MTRGILYYSHGGIATEILTGCQAQIRAAGLPIVSCTLVPMDMGTNIVLDAPKGAPTMFRQILTALDAVPFDEVCFAEHDVLYHPSHWTIPLVDDQTFVYNVNVWRWNYYSDRVISYDDLVSVSGLAAPRALAIAFYRRRLQIIAECGSETRPTFGNPQWAREMGYEPGKQTRRAQAREPAQVAHWRSPHPNIDIRHTRTMTVPKLTLESFVHRPTGWRESTLDQLSGWDDPAHLVRPTPIPNAEALATWILHTPWLR